MSGLHVPTLRLYLPSDMDPRLLEMDLDHDLLAGFSTTTTFRIPFQGDEHFDSFRKHAMHDVRYVPPNILAVEGIRLDLSPGTPDGTSLFFTHFLEECVERMLRTYAAENASVHVRGPLRSQPAQSPYFEVMPTKNSRLYYVSSTRIPGTDPYTFSVSIEYQGDLQKMVELAMSEIRQGKFPGLTELFLAAQEHTFVEGPDLVADGPRQTLQYMIHQDVLARQPRGVIQMVLLEYCFRPVMLVGEERVKKR